MSADGAVEAARMAPAPQRWPNFGRLAPFYRWMEWLSFGPYLWRARCAFLQEMTAVRRALILGDGDGRFTAAFLRKNRRVRVDAVDLSEAMLNSLRRRAGSEADRVRTQAADIRQWTPTADESHDLVVSHFFLDCLTTEEVCALARRVQRSLVPGAAWVISEFQVPGGAFGWLVARPVVAFLYWAFAVLTGLTVRRLPDYRDALAAAGFTLAGERRWLRGLLVSEMWRRQNSG